SPGWLRLGRGSTRRPRAEGPERLAYDLRASALVLGRTIARVKKPARSRTGVADSCAIMDLRATEIAGRAPPLLARIRRRSIQEGGRGNDGHGCDKEHGVCMESRPRKFQHADPWRGGQCREIDGLPPSDPVRKREIQQISADGPSDD